MVDGPILAGTAMANAWSYGIQHPDRIAIHQAYFDARPLLVTNTLGQAGKSCTKGVSEADWQRINQLGVELARSVGNGQQYVLHPSPATGLVGERIPNQIDSTTRRKTGNNYLCRRLMHPARNSGSAELIAAILRRDTSVTQSIPLSFHFLT